jgi:ribosomal protein L11 methyltransferase
MIQDYKSIRVYCPLHLTDLLIAEMSVEGYDSFLYLEDGFQASIFCTRFNEKKVRSLFQRYATSGNIEYKIEVQEEKNWNEIWEKNYDPVIIDDYCIIRAAFHSRDEKYPMEIVINPKMSFGTGHHETTRLMIKIQFEIDHIGKTILDVGCGTGILSIIAEKLGAVKVIGLDTDQWAYENALENVDLNTCREITILQHDISRLPIETRFDIIYANINRQIILKDMSRYTDILQKEGLLVCSGFLSNDKEIVLKEADRNHLGYLYEKKMNKWSALVFQKKLINFSIK